MFDLLDEDGSNNVSAEEFETFGFLFNFRKATVRDIFKEFDISGDQVLNHKLYFIFKSRVSAFPSELSFHSMSYQLYVYVSQPAGA